MSTEPAPLFNPARRARAGNKLGIRLRALRFLMKLRQISKQSELDLLRMQGAGALPRNAITNYLFGRADAGAEMRASKARSADGSLQLRVYRPHESAADVLPVVFYFHGGGFVLGSSEPSDWLCSRIATGVGAVVVSVEYRLAPTHRWPVAAEDCYAAMRDVVSRAAEFGIDSTRIAVVGDSAGGNLAAVVPLIAAPRSGPRIAFQVLIYPALDLTCSSPSVEENADTLVITKEDYFAAARHYLHGQDPTHPLASPIFAPSHAGLPPALIQVASLDPVRDDGVRYADALSKAGVAVRLTNYDGMPHGYLAFPNLCSCAPGALSEIVSELRAALIRDPS